MREKKYRTYTKEFKLEALELLESSGKSAAQLERELGITTGLLLKWRVRYQVKREDGEARLAPSDMAEAQADAFLPLRAAMDSFVYQGDVRHTDQTVLISND